MVLLDSLLYSRSIGKKVLEAVLYKGRVWLFITAFVSFIFGLAVALLTCVNLRAFIYRFLLFCLWYYYCLVVAAEYKESSKTRIAHYRCDTPFAPLILV